MKHLTNTLSLESFSVGDEGPLFATLVGPDGIELATIRLYEHRGRTTLSVDSNLSMRGMKNLDGRTYIDYTVNDTQEDH